MLVAFMISIVALKIYGVKIEFKIVLELNLEIRYRNQKRTLEINLRSFFSLQPSLAISATRPT
jgi:hypothetical protein